MSRALALADTIVGAMEGMMRWADYEWIPVDRRLPTPEDGPAIASGVKVAVKVLTVDMMLNGHNPETRGFRLHGGSFDDDDEGRQRVMFWAPCMDDSDLGEYHPETALQ